MKTGLIALAVMIAMGAKAEESALATPTPDCTETTQLEPGQCCILEQNTQQTGCNYVCLDQSPTTSTDSADPCDVGKPLPVQGTGPCTVEQRRISGKVAVSCPCYQGSGCCPSYNNLTTHRQVICNVTTTGGRASYVIEESNTCAAFGPPCAMLGDACAK